MNILQPIPVTDAVIVRSSIPELSGDEVAWHSGEVLTVGAQRVDGGYLYELSGVPGAWATRPSVDPINWKRRRPTNRRAPFDLYISTAARAPGSITYVLRPGFAPDLALHGLEADRVEVWVHAGDPDAGGQLLDYRSADMWEQAYGEREYLFGSLRKLDKASFKGLPIHPDAHITVKVSRTLAGDEVALGWLSVGNYEVFLGPQRNGGATEYGAEATPNDYGRMKFYDDGSYEYVARLSAVDIDLPVSIPAADANRFLATLRRIRGQAVSIEASDLPGYAWLSTVGVVTGTVRADSYGVATGRIQVKGFI